MSPVIARRLFSSFDPRSAAHGASAVGLRRAGRHRPRAAGRDRQVDLLQRGRHAAEVLLPADDHRRAAHQRLRLRRDDGRHGEGALPDHGGEPDRISRLRLRDRVGESDHRRRQQHGHAGRSSTRSTRTSTSSASTTRARARRPTSSPRTTKDRPWNQRQYMRVDWSQNLAGSRDGDGCVPALLGVASDLSTGIAVTEADDPLINPDRPIIAARLHRLRRTSETARPTTRPATRCSAPTTRSGRGVAATPTSRTATRCCRFPTSEYEPLSYPGPPGDHRTPTGRRCAWRSAPKASSPATRPSLKARGADAATTAPRRRSISSPSSATSARRCPPTTGRSARRRRGASTSRTAGTSGRRRSRRAPTATPLLGADGNAGAHADLGRGRRGPSPTT